MYKRVIVVINKGLINWMLTKSTSDTSVFRMDTIVHTKCSSRAFHKSALSSNALDVIQVDGASSLAKSSKRNSSWSCTDFIYSTAHCQQLWWIEQMACLLVRFEIWSDSVKGIILIKVTTLPVEANPSCRQATLASGVPQKSSHTVPHTLLLHISTRPSLEFDPPRSLISPWTQPVYI